MPRCFKAASKYTVGTLKAAWSNLLVVSSGPPVESTWLVIHVQGPSVRQTHNRVNPAILSRLTFYKGWPCPLRVSLLLQCNPTTDPCCDANGQFKSTQEVCRCVITKSGVGPQQWMQLLVLQVCARAVTASDPVRHNASCCAAVVGSADAPCARKHSLYEQPAQR